MTNLSSTSNSVENIPLHTLSSASTPSEQRPRYGSFEANGEAASVVVLPQGTSINTLTESPNAPITDSDVAETSHTMIARASAFLKRNAPVATPGAILTAVTIMAVEGTYIAMHGSDFLDDGNPYKAIGIGFASCGTSASFGAVLSMVLNELLGGRIAACLHREDATQA